MSRKILHLKLILLKSIFKLKNIWVRILKRILMNQKGLIYIEKSTKYYTLNNDY